MLAFCHQWSNAVNTCSWVCVYVLSRVVFCCSSGREPGAAPEVTQLGEERSTELSALVNNFILRRCAVPHVARDAAAAVFMTS